MDSDIRRRRLDEQSAESVRLSFAVDLKIDVRDLILSYVAGLITSYVFYRLSLRKSLSFFLLLNDQPLALVNADVRERLQVQFFPPTEAPDQPNVEGHVIRQAYRVGALQHLQFIIRNSGIRGIKFDDMPTIELPSGTRILDATIIHKHPTELAATLDALPVNAEETQKLRVAIPLLNKAEFVVIKILLSDAIDISTLALHLSGEDLPRSISWKGLPPDATRPWLETIEWAPTIVGSILLLCAGAMSILSLGVYHSHVLLTSDETLGFLTTSAGISVVLALAAVGIFFFVVFGLVLMLGIGLQSVIRPKRIVLPSSLRPYGGKPK